MVKKFNVNKQAAVVTMKNLMKACTWHMAHKFQRKLKDKTNRNHTRKNKNSNRSNKKKKNIKRQRIH